MHTISRFKVIHSHQLHSEWIYDKAFPFCVTAAKSRCKTKNVIMTEKRQWKLSLESYAMTGKRGHFIMLWLFSCLHVLRQGNVTVLCAG